MKMNRRILIIFILLFFGCYSYQLVSQADFLLGYTLTGSYLWGNIVGVSVNYDNIQNLLNNSLYQAYYINTNIKQQWANNWAVSIKVPLGHKYNCTAIQLNSTQNVTCTFQTVGNETYWSQLGNYVWNTMNPPNWCMGYDMQAINLTITEHQNTFFDWLYKVYMSTYQYLYCVLLVDYGDKMVQRGYKKSYTPDDFLKDIEMVNSIFWPLGHSGPGITQDASKEWLLALQRFAIVSWRGHFTVRCIIFKDPADMTIQKILSDNSTKYYLQKRFTVNSSYAYTDFSDMPTGINDIRLTTGEGVDGLTNSFAAALWALDITLQFGIMSGWEIDFNFQVRQGNYQSILGPEPELKPTALYYGLMFAVLARDGGPQIILPSTKSYISSKIKVFGLTNGDVFKVLLINKDTNTDVSCIYLEAASLTQTQKITIAGYNFVGGNASVNGTFRRVRLIYDQEAKGFHIPIKYAQAALCQTTNKQDAWPKNTKRQKSQNFLTFINIAIIMLIMILITI